MSSDRIAKYLEDKSFYKYWKRRKEEEEEVYGQREQEELNASYQQSLANKKEREKKVMSLFRMILNCFLFIGLILLILGWLIAFPFIMLYDKLFGRWRKDINEIK